MVVPATALYAIPPGSVCSPPYPCQINSHATHDFDINGRLMSSASASVSPSQKPMVGGLSCLFSSPTIKSSSYSGGSEELGSLWHDRKEELSSSFRCTPLSSSLKRDQAYQSPVSVFLSPSTIGSSSRSSFMRISGDSHSTRSGSTGLFSSFVRRALSSYVDYDTSSTDFDTKHFDPLVSSNVLADELPFNMEDNGTELDGLPPYARDLLNAAQSRNTIFRDDFVVKAFCEAEKAHRGQTRESGHPYLQHCVETAALLSDVGANSAVVAAGLLHDTVDDSFMTRDDICKTFGAEVSDLVEGVSKLSQLSKLARDNDTASKRAEADRLHTMYLAMAHVRAVLIKLADRLHNMMTLDALPLVKQQRFAKETLEIFVPLANRLGIFTWKEQLENLCFKYLYPDQYQSLSSKLVKCFDEAMVTSAVEKLEQALKDSAISYCCLSSRHKSLYSIYSKMSKKKLNFDEIHDIHGLRLIVETEEDCYKALRVVHQMWSELPGRFKDYILHRKCNGYQSLHTVVIGEGMVPLEVQIRTKEMHLQAEYGIASHWRYKEGDCKHFPYIHQLVEWARWILTWHCEAMRKESSYIGLHESMKRSCTFPVHSEDCPFSCNPQCASDGPVFVMMIENEKMSVQEFPADSSVVDVLERAGRGSSSSNPFGFHLKEELRPRLNHEPVDDPTCKLKMGDVVELTPTIPDKFLPSCREKIQRMYNQGVRSSHKPLAECREEIQHVCNHDVKPSPVPATTKTGSVRS